MKHLANIITGSRILFSLFLLCFPPFTVPFFVLYVLCGLSDMIDGPIARKTGTDSQFGSNLDSIADVVLILVCLVKLLPAAEVQVWVWVWTGVIACIRLMNIIWGLARRKQLILLHTIANKVAGMSLFLLPLSVPFLDINLAAIPVCAAATFAAVQEGYLIRRK